MSVRRYERSAAGAPSRLRRRRRKLETPRAARLGRSWCLALA